MLPEWATVALGRCSFPPPGSAVTCAVSVVAVSLKNLVLAVAAGCEVTAAHVDHGLRPDSAAEADIVEAVADRFGAGFSALTAAVVDGPNLEARARAARHAALPAGALLGHTMDDQAETIVLNLLRGSGTAGMAGMRQDGRRPLLGLRRRETRSLCEDLGIEPVEDPSNDDPRFRRNRVRHELMPLLADVAERDIVPVLARQAELFEADDDLIASRAEGIDPADSSAVRKAPVPVARRLLRRWIAAETGSAHPPDSGTVERALAVARHERRGTDLGGGFRLDRSGGVLRIERGGPGPSDDTGSAAAGDAPAGE
jgi:tRNA(Ile)-lysidine synthase